MIIHWYMRDIYIIYYTEFLKDTKEPSLSSRHGNDLNASNCFLIIKLLAQNVKKMFLANLMV